MEKWMKIEHPDLPDNDPALVTDEAFELLHVKKGWVVCGDDAETVETQESSRRDFSNTATKPKSKPTPKSK